MWLLLLSHELDWVRIFLKFYGLDWIQKIGLCECSRTLYRSLNIGLQLLSIAEHRSDQFCFCTVTFNISAFTKNSIHPINHYSSSRSVTNTTIPTQLLDQDNTRNARNSWRITVSLYSQDFRHKRGQNSRTNSTQLFDKTTIMQTQISCAYDL